MKRVIPAGVLLLLWLSACGREFKAPPPAATLSDFSPDRGFMDTAVGICGSHFDPQPESNLVYFGTQAAEVLPEGRPDDASLAGDFECDQNLLWVRVPELSEEGQVDLKVSTRYGQALSPRKFVYEGPGHPVLSSLKKKIDIRAGLWSVITPAESDVGTFVTIGVESKIMGVFEERYGLHLDFGLCETPLSAAIAVTDALELTAFFCHLNFTPPPEFGVAVTLNRWRVDMLKLVQGVIEIPEVVELPPTSQGEFVPNQIWTFPRPQQPQLWTEHDVAITHLSQGALAFVSAEDPAVVEIVELPAQALYCDPNRQANQTPIADLAYDPQAQDFYAALSGTNEIWRIPIDTRLPRRLWPPETAEGSYADCSPALSSLAVRRSQLAHANLLLYAADARALRVIEMELDNPGPDEHLIPTQNGATFDAPPFDLITGLYPTEAESGVNIAGERLYVATHNGLSILDVSDTTPLTPDIGFESVGELPVPMNRGGSQSLARQANFNLGDQQADTILFTDANRDQVLKLTCGDESIPLGDTATGSAFAQLATSYQDQRLYLSDAFSNTVHVVDRGSGLRVGEFPIVSLDRHPTMGFGSVGLSVLPGQEADLLLLPLTDLTGQASILTPSKFRLIAFGRIADELPPCGLTSGGLRVDESVEELFEQLKLVSWELTEGNFVPVLVLTRLAEVGQDAGGDPETKPGRVWCLEINPDPDGSESLLRNSLEICDLASMAQLGPEVVVVRPDRQFPILVQLETAHSVSGTQAIGVRLWDLKSAAGAADEGLLHLLELGLAGDITDMAMLSRDPQGRLYQVYLALPRMGHVLLVTFDLDAKTSVSSAIPVGGDPSLLAVSPDGKRVYVTHFFGGQIGVIRTDCQPAGQCEAVESSIEVSAWPGPVTFSDSGRAAYVVHYVSGDISWIE